MSTLKYVMRVNRRACPTAYKYNVDGSEPGSENKPGGDGGEEPVCEYVPHDLDHSSSDFTIISVADRPIAMQAMSIMAAVRRDIPVRI